MVWLLSCLANAGWSLLSFMSSILLPGTNLGTSAAAAAGARVRLRAGSARPTCISLFEYMALQNADTTDTDLPGYTRYAHVAENSSTDVLLGRCPSPFHMAIDLRIEDAACACRCQRTGGGPGSSTPTSWWSGVVAFFFIPGGRLLFHPGRDTVRAGVE